MAREHPLVAEVRRAGGGFVSDTAPLIYHLESSAAPAVLAAVDALFDAVEGGELGCFVSSVSAAELLVRPYRIGPPAVTVTDGFLRGPNIGLVRPSLGVAHGAARLVARGILPRLADAIVAATATELQLPLVTADRRLARSVGGFLVQEYV